MPVNASVSEEGMRLFSFLKRKFSTSLHLDQAPLLVGTTVVGPLDDLRAL
jgi:hypothetical protein